MQLGKQPPVTSTLGAISCSCRLASAEQAYADRGARCHSLQRQLLVPVVPVKVRPSRAVIHEVQAGLQPAALGQLLISACY